MDKDYIVFRINQLLDSYKLFNELAEHLDFIVPNNNGFWSSKFSELYYRNESIVYDMILNNRKIFFEYPDEEKWLFRKSIWLLIENGDASLDNFQIKNAEDLYTAFTEPDILPEYMENH